jgi:hypothetical protein
MKIRKFSDFISESISEDQFTDQVSDILLELEDIGLSVERSIIRKDVSDRTEKHLEITIRRPWGSPDRVMSNLPTPPGGKYPGELFFWYEIKDTIIRLNHFYYEFSGNENAPGINSKIYSELNKMGIKYNSNSPFRMFMDGTEFGIGWYKPEDFNGIADLISLSRLRIEMKI